MRVSEISIRFINEVRLRAGRAVPHHAAVWTNNLPVRPRQIAIAWIADRYTHSARREVRA